jgi:hypothetical protein
MLAVVLTAPAATAISATAATTSEVLEQRAAVMVRVPFDAQGRPVTEKAQLRVLDGDSATFAVTDHNSAEAAWSEGRVPGYIRLDRGLGDTPPPAAPVPVGYYSWRRGYPPAFVSSGPDGVYGWRYGMPGFYYGWNTASNSFTFGYGPGFSYGHVPGFGFAGGYSGWYGAPLGPGYTYPYPYWYRPGFGYYYYPRVGGGLHRF